MKKSIFIDPQARKELDLLPDPVREEFTSSFNALETNGKLNYPDAKKLDSNLFEIRIKVNGAYRGFYAYAQSNYVVILHIFQKKTQKTPLKNIKTAQKRLKTYD